MNKKLMKLSHRSEFHMKQLIKTFALSLYIFMYTGCAQHHNKENNIDAILKNGNIEFYFKNNSKILVYHYEINDYENFESDGVTYKRLFVSDEISKKMEKIIVSNYKEKNILDNHAYYILIGEQGLNSAGVGFTSLGFCLNKTEILTQPKYEKNSVFISKCHAQKNNDAWTK